MTTRPLPLKDFKVIDLTVRAYMKHDGLAANQSNRADREYALADLPEEICIGSHPDGLVFAFGGAQNEGAVT